MDIEALISAATQFDADFSHRIVGASAEDIARLEAVVMRLSGLTLPAFYKGYLTRLGHNDGGLRPPAHYASMKISNIIDYYEDLERDGNASEMLPERCIVFGYTGVGLFDLSLFFSDGEEPSVLFTSADQVKGECAETLEKMLHQIVFFRLERRQLKFLQSYRSADPSLDMLAIRSSAQKIGFKPKWFSDHITECAVSGGVRLWSQRSNLDPSATLSITGNDRDEVDRAASALKQLIPIELQAER
jgi:SMI1/KNR4 family protein SUKH-1